MIVLTDNPGLTAPNGSIFAVKVLAQREIYGSRLDLWRQSGPWGALALSRLSGITLCGDAPKGAALPELRAFLACLGGPVEGDAEILHRLYPGCPTFPVIAAPDSGARDSRAAVPERLSDVYRLLCLCDGAFEAASRHDAWLSDFSHRCRHGHSECFILREDQQIIATFSILFRANGRALGGAFAVHPAWRGRGYGSRLLSHAAAATSARGERLFVIAADGRRGEYYRRRGWSQIGLAARHDNNLEDI